MHGTTGQERDKRDNCPADKDEIRRDKWDTPFTGGGVPFCPGIDVVDFDLRLTYYP